MLVLTRTARSLFRPAVLIDLAAGALGMAVTAPLEHLAFTKGRTVFGDNGAGKGALSTAQVVARVGLNVAEVIAGMAVSEEKGALGIFGEGIAYAGAWHALRTLKVQYIGTGPVLGLAF